MGVSGDELADRLWNNPESSLRFASRLTPADGSGHGLHRSEPLTPYSAELLADDAANARRGCRLEITVTGGGADDQLEPLQTRLRHVHEQGVQVRIRREKER